MTTQKQTTAMTADTTTTTTVYGGERIWKAIAGNLIHIPPPNTTVYYFPICHVSQSPPSILCRVLHVSLLSHPISDHLFAKFLLRPLSPDIVSSVLTIEPHENYKEDDDEVVSFEKVLTPSDANNGGGFSVPRFCAELIFPPLDYEADPPVQTIKVRDINGQMFEFRHIFRGTPRRHLLTTGWSKFVNSKRLVAGDSVLFIKDKLTEELFVGVRRVIKPALSGKGREKVMEAVEKARLGEVFEVEYYPRDGVGTGEFVVEAGRVEKAMTRSWTEGVRVKMATETEDSSRVQWYHGTVVSVMRSMWRMLEVKWDEHEILKNMNRVSPWQVEYCSPPTPPIHTTFPPTKKIKYTTTSGMYDGEDELPLPSIEFSPMMGQLNPSYLHQNPFSAGMQGARQNQLLLSSLPNNNNNDTDNTPQSHPESHDASVSQRTDVVPMDLNAGKTSSNTPSPDSQNSVQLCCPIATGTKKAAIISFQLFGTTIHLEEPVNSVDDDSCTEYDDCGAKAAEETMDHTLVDPYKKVHDKLGGPCQRPPMVG